MMFNLMEVINIRLKDTGYSVFFNEKDKAKKYPFIVFNLPSSFEGSNIFREDFNLTIDIWTKNQTENITMTNRVKEEMDRFHFSGASINVSFYVVNRLNNIPDEDDQIKRSQLQVIAKTYFTN